MVFNLKRLRLAKKKFPQKGHKSQLPGIEGLCKILQLFVQLLCTAKLTEGFANIYNIFNM